MKRPAVIVYDVFDDDRRAQLRAALGPVAGRFQQSGWLVPDFVGVRPREVVALLAELLAAEDRLRVYTPCGSCVRAVRWLPSTQVHHLQTSPAWIVE